MSKYDKINKKLDEMLSREETYDKRYHDSVLIEEYSRRYLLVFVIMIIVCSVISAYCGYSVAMNHIEQEAIKAAIGI